MTDKRNGKTFETWKAQVDRIIVARAGMGCDDLPDSNYWDMWNDGTSPADAATEALDNAGFEEPEE